MKSERGSGSEATGDYEARAQRNLGYWRVRLPTLAPRETSGLTEAIRQSLKYSDLRSSVLDLMAAAINAQMGLGEEIEWLRCLDEQEPFVNVHPVPEELLEFLVRANLSIRVGDYVTAESMLEKVFSSVRTPGDDGLRVGALLLAAKSAWDRGELPRMRLYAEVAAEIPLTPGSHSYSEALWWLGLSEVGEGNVKEAKSNLMDYRKISKGAGNAPGLARAAYGLGWLCAHQGEWVEALRWLGEAAQQYECLRCNPSLICADLVRAIIHARMGKMGNAELALSRARVILGDFPWSIRDREWGKAVSELKN